MFCAFQNFKNRTAASPQKTTALFSQSRSRLMQASPCLAGTVERPADSGMTFPRQNLENARLRRFFPKTSGAGIEWALARSRND